MPVWEYFELEVIYNRNLGVSTIKGVHYKPDGKHVNYTGKYGEFLAQMGEQGWELSGAFPRGDMINYLFKREKK